MAYEHEHCEYCNFMILDPCCDQEQAVRCPHYAGGQPDIVNHPPHYGGDIPNNPYETIKVIEAWNLGFCDGNVVKYLSRWKEKGGIEDLHKALWYLTRFIKQEEDKCTKP